MIRRLFLLIVMSGLSACASSPEPADPPAAVYDHTRDMGLLWVKHAAEYNAITRQVYASATADLQGYIDDTSWSAMPGQQNAGDLPPAVILDVDETVLKLHTFS